MSVCAVISVCVCAVISVCDLCILGEFYVHYITV